MYINQMIYVMAEKAELWSILKFYLDIVVEYFSQSPVFCDDLCTRLKVVKYRKMLFSVALIIFRNIFQTMAEDLD